MKNIIFPAAFVVSVALGELALLGALVAACTREQQVKTVQVGADTAVCAIQHESYPPGQIAAICGLAEISDVVKILMAHRHQLPPLEQ